MLALTLGITKLQEFDASEIAMDIKTNSLYAQMQSMSMEAMGHRLPPAVSKAGSDFGSLLKDAVNSVNEIQQDAGEKKMAFEMGDRSVTLADTMIASSKAGIAFDATVQVRNKFVEAYKEIMSMPV
jgi:flagellar hook-basal body complex protein FliE